jgi:fumarylacetoacetase
VGFVVGTPSRLGEPVPAADWREHVFGVVLLNDWSARTSSRSRAARSGRSWASRSSPRCRPGWCRSRRWSRRSSTRRRRTRAPLDHLQPAGPALDLTLEVRLNGQLISRPPAAALYWTPAQQLAHLTGNGASLRTGDLYASGTVSGDAPTSSAACSS